MSESEQTMRRYLLGELSESEQSALEEKYFTDPQVFDQVLKTESELVDAYARDQLSKETRERVEKYFMVHPARAERVKFATALTTRVDQSVARSEKPETDSWWQGLLAALRGNGPTLKFSMALVTLLILLGGVWFFVERGRRQREAAQLQASQEAQLQREREQSQQAADERKRQEQLAAERERLARNSQGTPTPSPNPQSRFVSLALTVGGVRGGNNSQTPTLVIPPDITHAQLLLSLKSNDFPTYSATLQTIGGREIFRQSNVKPRRGTAGPGFTFNVPANKLTSGDYVLTLRGVTSDGEVEDLSKSLFRVEKK